jgi:transcriptional regulator with XRE-family HTH domain
VRFDPETFGRWLVRFRQSEGLSQDAVVKRSGGILKHSSVMSNLEKGTTQSPQVDILVGIATGLGVQVSYLLEKAGFIDRDEAKGRVGNFTSFERQVLTRALGGYLARNPDDRERMIPLLDEFEAADAAEALRRQRETELASR